MDTQTAGGWRNSAYLPHFLILLQSVLYGFGDPVSKIAFEVMPVYAFLSIRYTIALLILVFFFGRHVWKQVKAASPLGWILPCLCISLSYILSNVALSMTAATSMAFLNSLTVVMTPVLSWLVYRSPYHWYHIPIQIFSLFGLYLLCGFGGLSDFGMGEILTLISAFLMAGSLVFGQSSLATIDSITLTVLQVLFSVISAVACVFIFDGGNISFDIPVQAWSVILYMAVFCTIAGFMLQNISLTKMSARAVALDKCSYPVLTAFFSWILLGEHLSFAGIIGCIIILACMAGEIMLPVIFHRLGRNVKE